MSRCALFSLRGLLRLLQPDLCWPLKCFEDPTTSLRVSWSYFQVFLQETANRGLNMLIWTPTIFCFGNLLWAENLKSNLWQRTSNISFFKQKFAPFLNSEFFLLNSVSPPSVQSWASAINENFFFPGCFPESALSVCSSLAFIQSCATALQRRLQSFHPL